MEVDNLAKREARLGNSITTPRRDDIQECHPFLVWLLNYPNVLLFSRDYQLPFDFKPSVQAVLHPFDQNETIRYFEQKFGQNLPSLLNGSVPPTTLPFQCTIIAKLIDQPSGLLLHQKIREFFADLTPFYHEFVLLCFQNHLPVKHHSKEILFHAQLYISRFAEVAFYQLFKSYDPTLLRPEPTFDSVEHLIRK